MKLYHGTSKTNAKLIVKKGCVAVDDGTQVAIFDEKLIKKLKPRIVKK